MNKTPTTNSAGCSEDPLTLRNLWIPEEKLAPIRRELYHSTCPGIYVVRGFIEPDQAEHMRRIWSDPDAGCKFAPFGGKHLFSFGSPNMASSFGNNRTFFNFLWNPPLDEFTYTLAYYVHGLRYRVEGKIPVQDLLPLAGKSLCYRVIITGDADVDVAMHRDWWAPEDPLNKLKHDLVRLQVTLNLARYGQDYSGEGFVFVTTQGERLATGRDLNLEPGDLVLWRQNNYHGIVNVRVAPGQLGFMRIIYPADFLHPPSPAPSVSVPARTMNWLKRTLKTVSPGTFNLLRQVKRKLVSPRATRS
jgi:hypothetical protein